MKGGWVYLLTNRKRGALYTGVCADIAARMTQHRAGTGSAFCARYGIDRLVYLERHDDIVAAIAREKAIKKWRRAWKVELLERDNRDCATCSSTSIVDGSGAGSPRPRG